MIEIANKYLTLIKELESVNAITDAGKQNKKATEEILVNIINQQSEELRAVE